MVRDHARKSDEDRLFTPGCLCTDDFPSAFFLSSANVLGADVHCEPRMCSVVFEEKMDDLKLEIFGYAGLVGVLVWFGEKVLGDATRVVRQWKKLQREFKKHP